jgi:predicted glycosyltransferase
LRRSSIWSGAWRAIVHPFGETSRRRGVADLIRYTGYVAGSDQPPPPHSGAAARAGEVLVSAGGGAVGAPILLTALAARPRTPLRDHTWRFLTGPNFPEKAYQELLEGADPRTMVERFRPDFPARLQTAALSISQAGYNTTMDILRAGARAIVVPYEAAGETEQRLRADILAAKGLLTVLPAAELSPLSLADAITAALSTPRPHSSAIDLGGAARTAALIAALAAERSV